MIHEVTVPKKRFSGQISSVDKVQSEQATKYTREHKRQKPSKQDGIQKHLET